MGEWLTYSLADFLLFSPRTYDRLFELHNRAIWPAQPIALGLALAILPLLRVRHPWGPPAIAAILAAMWLWVAWAWLLERYATINWAAAYLAPAFVAEALLLLAAALAGRLAFRPAANWSSRTGLALFLFALIVQPLLGPLTGRAWPGIGLIGTTPDPTVTATLGILLTATRPPWWLLVVPLLWSGISGATAWALSAPDALLMPVVGIVSFVAAGWRALTGPPPDQPQRTSSMP